MHTLRNGLTHVQTVQQKDTISKEKCPIGQHASCIRRQCNQGNRYIFVFTDYLTRYAMTFPLETTDSVTVANVLVEKVIFRFGEMRQLFNEREATSCPK